MNSNDPVQPCVCMHISFEYAIVWHGLLAVQATSCLTLVMLNKLRCHTNLLFSANQITGSRLLMQIYINTNSADSSEVTDLDLHCLQRQGISRFSRIRVKLKRCFSRKKVLNV